VQIFGTGGENLKRLGQVQYFKVEDLEIIGLDGLIKKSFFIFRVFLFLKNKLREIKPDVVLLVDYPGFNLKFAKVAKMSGFKVIYYIPPQVWAWHWKRVKKLREFTDLVLSILPFEEALLKSEGINAKYVGNPALNRLKFYFEERLDFLEHLKLSKDSKIIGVLPGSRKREINSLMPVIAKAANKLSNFTFLIAKADTIEKSLIESHIKNLSNVKVIEELTYDIMKHSELLWVCSGTATLEAALMRRPMIILYKVSKVTYFLAKYFVTVKYIGLPNIILDGKFIPELLQGDCNDRNLVKTTMEMLENRDYFETTLRKITALFSHKDSSLISAQEIYSHIKQYS
jgi:lipid-A-disaccharide synthase